MILLLNALLVFCQGREETTTENRSSQALENKNNLLVDTLLGDIKSISNSIEKLRFTEGKS